MSVFLIYPNLNLWKKIKVKKKKNSKLHTVGITQGINGK